MHACKVELKQWNLLPLLLLRANVLWLAHGKHMDAQPWSIFCQNVQDSSLHADEKWSVLWMCFSVHFRNADRKNCHSHLTTESKWSSDRFLETLNNHTCYSHHFVHYILVVKSFTLSLSPVFNSWNPKCDLHTVNGTTGLKFKSKFLSNILDWNHAR